MQHSLQKNAHIYIPTPICIRIHMYANTHAHALHRPHAEALILRLTIYAQIRIHIHIHMCINAYIYRYIHTCTCIYIYTCPHTYTHTHISHMHTKCTYERTQSTSETTVRQHCAGSPNWHQEAQPFSLSTAIRRGIPFVASSPIALPVHEEQRISAEQPQPTAAHHTITTARCPDHIRLSALVRSRSTQFTAHPSCQLGRGPPKRGHFSAILAGFLRNTIPCPPSPKWYCHQGAQLLLDCRGRHHRGRHINLHVIITPVSCSICGIGPLNCLAMCLRVKQICTKVYSHHSRHFGTIWRFHGLLWFPGNMSPIVEQDWCFPFSLFPSTIFFLLLKVDTNTHLLICQTGRSPSH